MDTDGKEIAFEPKEPTPTEKQPETPEIEVAPGHENPPTAGV